jgi:DNA-binding GntR family transcriptional regulator
MSLGETVASNRTKTMHQYVLKSLRDAIVDGRLVAGTHLVQSDLANQLDVSITPVREALRDLASEGLVVLDPHRGALVRSLDLSEVRELYELRTALEPMMVRRVVHSITEDQLSQADDLRHQMERTKDLSAWAELNRQFHAMLTTADDSSRLANILTVLRDSASTYVTLSLAANTQRLADSNVEHAELVALYRERDVERAVELTIRHLQTTLDTIVEAQQHGAL